MSTNCLVTKLKGVVDNDNLIKLGEIKVNVEAASITRAAVRGGSVPCTITLGGTIKAYIDNAKTTEISSPFTSIDHPDFYLEGEGEVSVLNKYALRILRLKGITLQDIMYCSEKFSSAELLSGDVSKMDEIIGKYTSLTRITFTDSEAYGEIPLITTEHHALTELKISDIPYTSRIDVTGSIMNLVNLLSLQTLDANKSKVSGEINDFAAAQVAKGRGTNGEETLTIYGNGTYITYSGASINNARITYNSSLPNGYSVETFQ
jgi:hypothetical protein